MVLTRRALVGGVAALWARPAGAEGFRLEAAPLAGAEGALGYNGASPGPTLRGRVGAQIALRLVNRLDAPTSLRLPGSPALAEAALAPGAARDFAFTPKAPGFDLYFPEPPAAPPGQFGAGLFGAIVIEEAAPPPVDLDAVVVAGGAARPPWRLTAAPGGRVRLRLANASPDALLTFRASGAAPILVAIDGQPCEPFAPRGDAFALCPLARIELMFDLGDAFALALPGGLVLQIAPSGAQVDAKPPIAALPANPRLPEKIALERARQVRVVIASARGGYALGGGGTGPLFKVARGSPVALTLVNETGAPQTLRLEGHSARILHALDDGWDPYWRDALWIAPGRTLHAAFVADAPGRWLLASASPERRVNGLTGWFEVD